LDTQSVTKVVILGGGFAGVSAAMEFSRRVRRDAGIEVHLVSDENYFVFQPMLPEVVACGIEPTHIVNPIRQLCPHVRFHCATVRSVDLEGRRVTLVGSDETQELELGFDHLLICVGLSMDLSRIPGMSEHSLPIKTLGDAFVLRNHVLTMLEQADIEPDETKRKKLLTFVGVGGGFSGVETVAEINDMVKAVLKYYPNARATGARVVLIHSRDRILNELGKKLARFAQKKLSQRGVELVLESRVKEATPEGIVLADGRSVSAGTVVCTVGNAPHPLIKSLDLPKQRDRLTADTMLRVEGCEHIWTCGDTAIVPDTRRGGFCPPTAQYALRAGRRCARNVLAVIRGQNPRPFQFGGLGQLAVVGRRSGVAQVLGINFSGFVAWWFWRSVYWMKLPGMRAKARVGLDWAMDVIFPRDITKLDLSRTQRLRRAHYKAGETIVRQGEVGDRFYIIDSGEVEVIREESGQEPQRLATQGAGESFGEIALIEDTPRTATVRCLTAVDVLCFSRDDFQALMSSYTPMREVINESMRKRHRPQ